jgi:hypothetical protein
MTTDMHRRFIITGTLFTLICGVVGVLFLLSSQAATPTASIEAETGTPSGPAQRLADTSASDNSAVMFKASTSSAILPSQIVDLTNWKITLPTDGNGSVVTATSTCPAIEVKQPQLASYSISPWFQTNSAGDGIQFRANIDGCTTSGSGYPRSELREMTSNGTANADWSTTSGTHTMTVTEAVTHLPVVKPQTVFAQIHNASDDVFEAEAFGQSDGSVRLYANHNGTEWGQDLDSHYILGTKFTLKVVASGGYVDIYYNGTMKVHQAISSTGDYFKAGDYTQSNIVKGQDAPGAYGEVDLYALSVTHS